LNEQLSINTETITLFQGELLCSATRSAVRH